MQSFVWGENYLTGLADVDDQHHKLVDLLNQFSAALTENELADSDIRALLCELAEYANYHFQEEEKLMQAAGIDGRHLQFHQKDHANFMQQILAMKDDWSVQPSTAKQILGFLINWLAYHILGVDQNMARQVAAIKVGVQAESAYWAEEQSRSQATEPLLAALTGLYERLSERNKALLEMNKTLEEKVLERTRALTVANSQLEQLAMTDVLTELPNRRYAMAILRQLWDETEEQAGLLVCMMIDADGFKQINDNYGHESGDLVLKALARELKHSVRTDDVVCRLGGDEFLIICADTPLAGAMYLAEQVRKAVADLRVPAGEGIWLGSISVGVAVRTADMGSPDALLKAADDGVYCAKRDGRNCVRSIHSGGD